jgi:tetratricopeptide (TPR) repeat protein
LAVEPTDVYTLFNKGVALDNLGNHTGAIKYFDKALAMDPKDIATLTSKGNALNELGNHTGAIKYFDKALAIDPKYEDALNGKGLALNSIGDHTGAKIYLDKAFLLLIRNRYPRSLTGTQYREFRNFLIDEMGISQSLRGKDCAPISRGREISSVTIPRYAILIAPSFASWSVMFLTSLTLIAIPLD